MAEAFYHTVAPDSLPGLEPGAVAAGGNKVDDPYYPARVSHVGKKTVLLVLIVALFFVNPSLGAYMAGLGLEETGYVFVLTLSLLVHMWCRYDAAERGRSMNLRLSLGIAVVVIAGFPQYLHDIRGYSYGKAISIALLWVLICFIVAFAGASARVAVFGI